MNLLMPLSGKQTNMLRISSIPSRKELEATLSFSQADN
jgi:hypothetical protein